MRRTLFVTSFAALLGCSSSDVPPALGSSNGFGNGMLAGPLTYSGTPGEPIPATILEGVVVVDVTVDGVTGTVVVDTGSPVLGLDPGPFAGAAIPNGSGTVSTLDVGGLTFSNAPTVGADLIMSGDPSAPLDGTMGCTILCDFSIGLNYRDSTFSLGASTMLPQNIESPGQSVPFTLEGGGLAQLDDVPGDVTLPRSRIPLDVTIEGAPYHFILDTGSGDVFVSQAILAAVTADGRATMGTQTEVIGGVSSSTVTRLRSVVIGGAEVDGLLASGDQAIDTGLAGLAAEVGHTVDGLIGGSFLRDFYVTIDYPNETLHLQRYTVGGPTFDDLDRVGLGTDASDGSGGVTVSVVVAGTDASAKGVEVGDVILSVDGVSLANIGATAADAIFAGPVGSTKMVQFGHAASATLSMQTIAIACDDVLPL